MHLPVTDRRRGFTLIEVLVVVTLIAIAALVSMPAIGRSVANTRVQRASTVMASDLRTAFAMSAQQRRPIKVAIDAGQRVVRIQNRSGDTTFATTWYDGSTDLVVRQLTAVPDTLLIYPGGLAAAGITVNMETIPRYRRQITANRAGQVRITQP